MSALGCGFMGSLIGIYITLGVTTTYVIAARILDMNDTFDTIIDGFKTMIEPLGVLVAISCSHTGNFSKQRFSIHALRAVPLMSGARLDSG